MTLARTTPPYIPKPKHRLVPQPPPTVILRCVDGFWEWETTVFGPAFRALIQGIAESRELAIERATAAHEIDSLGGLRRERLRIGHWQEVRLP